MPTLQSRRTPDAQGLDERTGNRLHIQSVSKTYRNGTRALDGVSLTLGNGMFGLLGPNGAGKSTLMRSLATLQRIDAGSIHFNGVDVQQQPEQLRSLLGYLPQEFGVYPDLSALQLLDYLAIVKGLLDKRQRRAQIEQLLSHTNLYPHRHQAVSEFSGGMRQRFGIAQALLGRPRLLIVDEPTAGLDPTERNSFHQLLSGFAEHMVVLLSTHIVEDVRHLCPQLAVLNRGRLCFTGAPNDLVQRLQGRLWAAPPGAVAGSTSPCHRLSTRIIGGATQLRVYAEDCPGSGFQPAEPDLEDGYFLALAADQDLSPTAGADGVPARPLPESAHA